MIELPYLVTLAGILMMLTGAIGLVIDAAYRRESES